MTSYMVPPPKNIPLSEILPTEPLLLMGAGPVPIPHAVASANGVVINHMGDTMNEIISRVKTMAKYAFQTSNDKIFGISGPSSAAMEMGITNLLWPGRSALVCSMGTFSHRFSELASGVGSDVTIIEPKENKPFSVEEVEKAFESKSFDVLTIVQGETSCGILNTNLKEIVRVAKKNNCLVIVDAVCTLTTMPLSMDEWGIDVVVTGGQKGLSSIPGVSLIAFSNAAWDVIENRKVNCPHWCLDARKANMFWTERKYHYTAPVPGILAMYEALRLITIETLDKRFERHHMSSRALQKGLEAMGLTLFVPEEYRLNSVVAIDLPKKAESSKILNYMIDKFNVEISGAFGLNIIRIGQMGEQCRSQNLFKVLYALGMSFRKNGFEVDIASGMARLEENLVLDLEHFVE
jgi:alanine-glyoxylate transaminase / serine-glyoxylate transaminase / serine-pyruvate transaminase